MPPTLPLTKVGSADVPQEISQAIGIVISRDAEFLHVNFSTIESNPASVRGKTVVFEADPAHPVAVESGGWVRARWMKTALFNTQSQAIRLEGKLGRAELVPLDRSAASSTLQTASQQLKSQHQKHSQQPAGPPAPASPHKALQVGGAAPSGNFTTPDRWLPVPVGLPVMADEAGFDAHYTRIGYVSFTVDSPAEEIVVTEAIPARSVSTLRSRTPIQKDNWHSIQQVVITLTLNGSEDINGVLLPLVKLFRRAPFQPIYNRLLHEQEITAIALQNLAVETVAGFPHCLKARLTCYAFNWEAFLSAADQQQGMDALFCYPLLKLWIESPQEGVLPPEPISDVWDGLFALAHPSEPWLQAVSELPNKTNRYESIRRERQSVEELLKAQSVDLNVGASSVAADALKDPENFDYEGGIAPGLPGERRYLSGDWGRVNLSDGQSYILFRPRTLAAATLLLVSAELVGVIAGPVEIERRTRIESSNIQIESFSDVTPLGLTNVSRSVWDPQWSALDPLSFHQQLQEATDSKNPNAGGQGPVQILEDGHYTFLFHAPATILRQILNQPTPQPPPQNIEGKIQPDLGNLIEDEAIVIESISAAVDNTLAPLQVRGHRTPTFQYLGSTSIQFQISGILRDSQLAGRFQRFFDRVTALGRKYRGRLDGTPFGGFVMVTNELFHLLGVRNVLPVSWSTSTIPGFPEALRFQLTLVEFDATQRRREVLKDVNEKASENRRQAISSQRDPSTLQYWRASLFNQELRQRELYPDLALPTHKQIAGWLEDIQNDRVWDWDQDAPFQRYSFLDPAEGGTGWQWHSQAGKDTTGALTGKTRSVVIVLPDAFKQLEPPTRLNRFADPDFYCASSQNFGPEMVEKVLRATLQLDYKYTCTYGMEARAKPGERLDEHKITQGKQILSQAQAAADARQVLPVGSSMAPIDDARFSQSTSPDPVFTPDGKLTNPTALADLPNPGVVVPTTLAPNDVNDRDRRFRYYRTTAEKAADTYGIPHDWFFAIIDQESSWNSQAENQGAVGLGQLRSAARAETGLNFDVKNPALNLFAAAHYLRNIADRLKQRKIVPSIERVVAGYNQGPNSIAFNPHAPSLPEGTEDPTDGITPKGRKYLQEVAEIKKRYTPLIGQEKGPTPLQVRSLAKEFSGDRAYPFAALKNYIVGLDRPEIQRRIQERQQGPLAAEIGTFFEPAAQAADAVAGFLLRATAAPERFIQPGWLARRQSGLNAEVTLETLVNASDTDAYVIRPQHLEDFLHEIHHRNVVLPTEDVNQSPLLAQDRVNGKAAYDYQVLDSALVGHSINKAFYDAKEGRDLFHALREELTQGRLLGAFPTFFVALVDGGRWLGVWRLFDHVYGMLGVTQIAVHRTRKGPVDTAVVGLSNMYGHLTSQSYEIERIESQDTRGVWNQGAVTRGFQALQNPGGGETLGLWSQHLDSLMLKAGTRLHIRLGYGSDAVNLPIVFNGVITEVPISEGEIEVVALSDGLELMNDIPPDALQGGMPVTRRNAFLAGGLNPREMVMSFMAPNSLLDSAANSLGEHLGNGTGVIRAAGNLISSYYDFRNPYGIEHFGSPIRRGLGFDDGEIGINIYNPGSMQPLNRSTGWDNFARIFQPTKWDSTDGLIGLDMAGATPWGVIEMARHTIPDYIAAVEPVDLRSTLYVGKGWFPFYGSYRHEIDGSVASFPPETPRETLFESRPFQQLHLVSSDWNLVGNLVRADATNVVTKVQAIGTYAGWLPGQNSLESSFVMMVDEYIFDEFQKMKVVESGLYSTFGMKIGDAFAHGGGEAIVTGIGETVVGLLAKSPQLAVLGVSTLAVPIVRSFLLSRRVLDHYAAMALKDHVKEMYQGPLVLLGNARLKPYDYLAITDQLSGLNGLAEAREVTHTFSLDSGFVTSVTPDCLASYQDFEGQDLIVWLSHAGSHFLTALAMARVVGNLARSTSPGASLLSLGRLEKALGSQIEADVKAGAPAAQIATKQKVLQEIQSRIATIQSVQKVGGKSSAQVRPLLEKIATDPEFLTALETIPTHVKAPLLSQRFLMGLPSSKAGQFATKSAAGAKKLLAELNKELPNNFQIGVADVAMGIQIRRKAKAIARLSGGNKEFIQAVRQLLKNDLPVDASAQDLATAITEFDELKGLRFKVRLAGAARTTLNVGSDAFTFTRELFSKSSAPLVLATAFQIGIGSLADWATRWNIARQCLTLLPLRIFDKEFSAGINGHHGAVYGDVLIGKKKLVQLAVDWARESPFGQLVPVLGDLAAAGINFEKPALPAWIAPPEQQNGITPR